MSSPEWDAASYDQVATVQQAWGLALLERIDLQGDETMMDAGCGTGSLAESLLQTHPRLRVIAVDHDPNMVRAAKKRLAPHGARQSVHQADLQDLPPLGPVDLIYSNATLHWVRDLDAACRGFSENMRPGGRLFAQFGTEGNLQTVRRIAERTLAETPYSIELDEDSKPWHYHSETTTRRALEHHGLRPRRIERHDAPVEFPDDETWRRFLRTVTLRHYLTRLESEAGERFISDCMEAAEKEGMGRRLDYVRLTVEATAQ